MPENSRANEPLDDKLRDWLLADLNRRELPMHWLQPLQQLLSWASTYRDGKALHDLLKQYPRQARPPDPVLPAPSPDGSGRPSFKKSPPRARYDPDDNAARLAAGLPQRRPNP